MPESSEDLLERHTADWDEAARTLGCSCGDTTGYVAHIATLLGTDETAARESLLAAHEIVAVNAGMCGGCETCGNSSAEVHCPICGDDYDPCLTWFVASGRGPAAEPDIEGSK